MAPALQTQPANFTAEKDASYIPRGDVEVTLKFFELPADGSKPHSYVDKPTDGRPQFNYGSTIDTVTMHDIRNRESKFSLDKDAFQALSGISSAMSEEDWASDETIQSVYYPEVVKLILDEVPGTHKVTIFDHTVRYSAKKDYPRGPVQMVHVDQTRRAAKMRVELHDPEEAESLLKGRYRIINVWRSIGGPVQSFPLGFASADTVKHEDLIANELRYPNRTGETAGVRYNPEQRFYYWSGIDNAERLFLKCSDSRLDVGMSAPHTAFVDPRTPEGAKGRSSIEVRCIVYG